MASKAADSAEMDLQRQHGGITFSTALAPPVHLQSIVAESPSSLDFTSSFTTDVYDNVLIGTHVFGHVEGTIYYVIGGVFFLWLAWFMWDLL